MTESGPFLEAIEADPADDARWLVFADWLEERGDPAAESVRAAIAGRSKWEQWRDELLSRLDLWKRPQMDSDVLERVLPIFERVHPEDRGPRDMVEALRDWSHLKQIDRFIAPLLRSGDTVYLDRMRGHDRFRPANSVRYAAWAAATAAKAAARMAKTPRRSGKFALTANPKADGTDWNSCCHWASQAAAHDSETRWQVARLLHYLSLGPREIPPRP